MKDYGGWEGTRKGKKQTELGNRWIELMYKTRSNIVLKFLS